MYVDKEHTACFFVGLDMVRLVSQCTWYVFWFQNLRMNLHEFTSLVNVSINGCLT